MASNKSDINLCVNKEWCKGCAICVVFCPKNVLEIHNEKVNIKNPNNCIKCGLCEMRCPDYAIYLGGMKNEESC